MTDILADLEQAAARKWAGDPDAQRAGLFARAAVEVRRLRARVLELEAVHEDASGAILEERERWAKLRITAEQALADMRAQDALLEWQTLLSDALDGAAPHE